MRGERAHIWRCWRAHVTRASRHGAAAVINACGGQRRLRTYLGHAQRPRDPCGGHHNSSTTSYRSTCAAAHCSPAGARRSRRRLRSSCAAGSPPRNRRPAGRYCIPAPGMAARYTMALQCHGRSLYTACVSVGARDNTRRAWALVASSSVICTHEWPWPISLVCLQLRCVYGCFSFCSKGPLR